MNPVRWGDARLVGETLPVFGGGSAIYPISEGYFGRNREAGPHPPGRNPDSRSGVPLPAEMPWNQSEGKWDGAAAGPIDRHPVPRGGIGS